MKKKNGAAKIEDIETDFTEEFKSAEEVHDACMTLEVSDLLEVIRRYHVQRHPLPEEDVVLLADIATRHWKRQTHPLNVRREEVTLLLEALQSHRGATFEDDEAYGKQLDGLEAKLKEIAEKTKLNDR